MLDPACLAAWNLPTDPFAYAKKPLAPLLRNLDLEYYYDFYDWADKNAVGSLGANGRIASWAVGTQGKMTLLLISGAQGCGRSSLKNLMLFELTDRCAPAVVVEYTLSPSPGRTQSAIALARAIEREVKRIAPKLGSTANDTINTWRDDLIAGEEPDVDSLFARLKDDVVQALPDARVIVALDALVHKVSRDAAHATAIMVQQIADFVVLSVTDTDDARFIRGTCTKAGQPVALVAAPKVNLDIAKKFVAAQLSRSRLAAQDPAIYPFTEDALTALFAPATRGAEPVRLPLRVAIEKLADAMSRRCSRAHAAPDPISAADMRAVLGL